MQLFTTSLEGIIKAIVESGAKAPHICPENNPEGLRFIWPLPNDRQLSAKLDIHGTISVTEATGNVTEDISVDRLAQLLRDSRADYAIVSEATRPKIISRWEMIPFPQSNEEG